MEHECEYKERVAVLEKEVQRIGALEAELAQLKKALLGPKSEKLPRPVKSKPADPVKTQEKRAANRELRDEQMTEFREDVEVADKTCPSCGNDAEHIGEKTSVVVDYVPGHFIRRVVARETVACRCGDFVKTADTVTRALGQSKYGAGFIAHLCVAKVCDSIPVYRMEKQFKRMDCPMARSTMNNLVMKAGEELRIINERILSKVAEQPVVLADETSLPVVAAKKCKRGFIWNFSAETEHGLLVGYRFSANRSRQTPIDVLGASEGKLLVDGYAGYNAVTTPEGRERAACWAHPRRKFFDAIATAPIAEEAVKLIGDIYRVEHLALERGVSRTKDHLELRRTLGREAVFRLRDWLDANASQAPPKSPLGRAISHTLKIWDRLLVFLDDVDVPIDNNASERFLRPVAKGRDNWMFAGNENAAENIAALWAITTSCEANGKNPWEYIGDVLMRIGDHPVQDIDMLLPDRWTMLDV